MFREVITVGAKQVQHWDPKIKRLVCQVAAYSRHGNAEGERRARRELALAMQRQRNRQIQAQLDALDAEVQP